MRCGTRRSSDRVSRVAEALAVGGLDFEAAVGDGVTKASLRRLLFDFVEEYGRHTGHADLLRESMGRPRRRGSATPRTARLIGAGQPTAARRRSIIVA